MAKVHTLNDKLLYFFKKDLLVFLDFLFGSLYLLHLLWLTSV